MKRILAGTWIVLASLLPATEIAIHEGNDFDQALDPSIPVLVKGPSWIPVSWKAWADPALGAQALDVELLNADGQPLQRLRDVARAAPIAPGEGGGLWVPVDAATRALRFRVRGRGPAVGTWELRPGLGPTDEAWVLDPLDGSFSNGVLGWAWQEGGPSLMLNRKGSAFGRLAWGHGWRLLGALTKAGHPAAPDSRLMLEGPAGQRAVLSIGATATTMIVTLAAQGSQPSDLALAFEPAGEGSWLLPFNQGLRVPAGQAKDLGAAHDLDLRSGHFVSMPGFGWEGSAGILWFASQSPADGTLRLDLKARAAALVTRPSQGTWGSPTAFQLSFSDPGGLPSLLDRYRHLDPTANRFALKRLGPQQRQRLAGAVNIHYWKKVAWWTNEPRPEALAAEMKAAGLDRVLWSQKVAPEAVTPMAQLGWLLGSYENFQDLYPSETPLSWVNKTGWPEQAVLWKHGGWVRGWPHKEGAKTYYAGVRSSRAAVDYVRAELDARQQHGQHAVFLDTTTATGPVEDWNPLHPMTRSEDLRYKREQLAYGVQQGLIVGSESGHDGALGAAHYFEGMQSPWVGRFEDSGYDLGTIKPASEAMKKWNLSPRYRAPLFDLAYHDLYVGYEYWGDAANRLPKHWRRKDLFSVLYAQPQLWVMDEERWKTQQAQALKSYRTWSPVVRHLFGQRMTDWKVLDKVGDVQETHWEDGSVVRVDFRQDRVDFRGPLRQVMQATK